MRNPFIRGIQRSLATLLLGACLTGGAAAEVAKGPAPDFTLESRSGENLRLSEFRGEVVMINFWASWCGPCRQEMPLLDDLYQRYSRLGFTILGVNVEEDPSKAHALLEHIPVSFPILFDSENTVSQQYQLVAMPSTVLVDRDGNIRYLHKGYSPGDEQRYDELVRGLIRE